MKRPWHPLIIIVLDIVLLGAALCVFALFHHVIPYDGGEPILRIVELPSRQPVSTPKPTEVPSVKPTFYSAKPRAKNAALSRVSPVPAATKAPAATPIAKIAPLTRQTPAAIQTMVANTTHMSAKRVALIKNTPIPEQTMVVYAPSPVAKKITLVKASPAPTPTPFPTPSPVPTEPPIGDFSNTFPDYDTGASSLHSYQSDNLRVAVNKVESGRVVYFVADIWIRYIDLFKTAFAKDQYGRGFSEMPASIAREVSAVIAVTGDYYGSRDSGLVIRNGLFYREASDADVCVLYADGTMETYSPADFDIEAAIARGAYQGWSFGPMLLDGGEAMQRFNSRVNPSNPRCAIGYIEPGHYCLVLVDGRQARYSDGMTLVELSSLMEELGCKTAYNLDGGQTAAMVFNGEVINSPSDGGRKVSDIVYFGEIE